MLSGQSLGVRDSGGRLRAIRWIQVCNWKESARGERKEEASSSLPRTPDEYCLGRCYAETLQERGSSAVGDDCVSVTHQRRSRRPLIPPFYPSEQQLLGISPCRARCRGQRPAWCERTSSADGRMRDMLHKGQASFNSPAQARKTQSTTSKIDNSKNKREVDM